MYNNGNQYPQGYPNNYNYSNYSGAGYNMYDGYNQSQPGYNVSGNMQPVPPGDEYPQNNWAPVGNYNNMSSNQTSQQQGPSQSQPAASSAEKINNKSDAVAEEMKKQNAELIKQREEYEKRVVVLQRELELLRKQKQELLSEDTSERDTEHILKENGKLQVEIKNKLKDAYKVIEILSGVIGDAGKPKSDDESSPTKYKGERRHRSISSDNASLSNKNKYNYIHYDPELHWCRLCDVFPKTAKDLLVHLHSKEHHDAMQEENMEVPWHKLPREPEFPYYEGAPKKRLPIKGLQFFISATAWYCRLCDTWIGDLHCASLHLKSLTHSQNYTNFVEQNPHWEIEWLKDREKAFERTSRSKDSDSDDTESRKKKKHKDKRSPSSVSKDKKKKKKSKKRRKHSSDSSSSSSSSDSSSDDDKDDKSRSIRVAMRNKFKSSLLDEASDKKWEVLGRLVEEKKRKVSMHQSAAVHPLQLGKDAEGPEDNLINQWMSVKEPEDGKDKYLLDSLKDRLRSKQEQEKQKVAEMERKRREKEKAEQEVREREEREARELEERKRREEEERGRLKERDREQVRFKQRGHYRSRKSSSRSPKRSRSRSIDRYERKYSESSKKRSHTPDSPDRKRRSKDDDDKRERKAPPPPSYKKLPFIGRMPLFKNKKPEEKVEKEIKKEDYEPPRQTRFQPGNLARAFIPDPEVVCFPKLSSYPPITIPPPAPPAPPKISQEPTPAAPPPPNIKEDIKKMNKVEEEVAREEMHCASDELEKPIDYEESMNMMYPPDQGMNQQYPYDYNMIYPHPTYDYSQDVPMESEAVPPPPPDVPLSHTLPLQPPPLPPDDDDLAMLGMSSDDLAAQTF